jgi:hypothetical protein
MNTDKTNQSALAERGCVADQPQQSESLNSLGLAMCCGWRLAHSRAPHLHPCESVFIRGQKHL